MPKLTYTELKREYWNLSDKKQKEFLSLLGEPTRKAWEIIGMLKDREGFEHWWVEDAGGMDYECNDEIFSDLVKIISGK